MTDIVKKAIEQIERVSNSLASIGETVDYTDVAVKALDQTRWISVSERLPGSDEDVLVTNGVGIYVGWIDATDKCWRVDSESEYFMNDIVAWMPLPEPYKVESEDKE